MIITERKCD